MAVYPVTFSRQSFRLPHFNARQFRHPLFDCVQCLSLFIDGFEVLFRCRPDGGHFRAPVKSFYLRRVFFSRREGVGDRLQILFLRCVTMFLFPRFIPRRPGLPFFFGQAFFDCAPRFGQYVRSLAFDFLLHCPPALRRIIRVDRHGFHG